MRESGKKGMASENELTRINRGGRIEYIDALKGFAICCTVLGHVVNGYLDANTYPAASTTLYRIYNIIYAFHMPLFMMISGYVFEIAYFDEYGLAKRSRIVRQIFNLLGNYIVFSLAYGFVKIALSGYVNSSISPRDLLLIGINPIELCWYVYDLMIFYVVFSQTMIRRIHRGVLLAILFIMACLSEKISAAYFDLNRLFRYAFFFYFGMTRKRYGDSFFEKGITQAIVLCAMVVMGVVFWNSNPYSVGAKELCYNNIPIIGILIAFGMTLLLWFMFSKWKFLSDNHCLTALGRHSLEIYLLHCFLTAGMRIVFTRLGIENVAISTLFNFVLSTTVTLMVSLCCMRMGIYDLVFKPASFVEKRRKG